MFGVAHRLRECCAHGERHVGVAAIGCPAPLLRFFVGCYWAITRRSAWRLLSGRRCLASGTRKQRNGLPNLLFRRSRGNPRVASDSDVRLRGAVEVKDGVFAFMHRAELTGRSSPNVSHRTELVGRSSSCGSHRALARDVAGPYLTRRISLGVCYSHLSWPSPIVVGVADACRKQSRLITLAGMLFAPPLPAQPAADQRTSVAKRSQRAPQA